MFIDQFTEEQLAVIRKELKELQKISKAGINEELWKKIDTIFDHESYSKECLFPYRAVSDAISTIVDYTIDNFVYKNNGRTKKQIGWYRAANINPKKAELYTEISEEILDVIRKYKTSREFPLKKPE